MALNWFKKKRKTDKEDHPEITVQTEKAEPEYDAIDQTMEDNAAAPETVIASETSTEDETDPVSETNTQPPVDSIPSKSGNGLFAKLKRGLTKTRDFLTTDIEDLFSGKSQLDDEMLEEIEELLITSDIGVQTTMDLMKAITKKASKIDSSDSLKQVLKQEVSALIETQTSGAVSSTSTKPHVVMVVGVNGVGKTTTIGKLAARKAQAGHKVMIAAADTFRAAAIDQLAIWAERAGAELIKHKENADPAAVVFDSMQAAIARGVDTLYVDTAGRLHTKINLMEELKKIQRTMAKLLPDAPHEILLVLDATTGQNAISQAKMFHESLGITGLALTKLDGTAKGGIVVSICRELQLPLHYIGVGEAIEDLQPFDATRFVDALF